MATDIGFRLTSAPVFSPELYIWHPQPPDRQNNFEEGLLMVYQEIWLTSLSHLPLNLNPNTAVPLR